MIDTDILKFFAIKNIGSILHEEKFKVVFKFNKDNLEANKKVQEIFDKYAQMPASKCIEQGDTGLLTFDFQLKYWQNLDIMMKDIDDLISCGILYEADCDILRKAQSVFVNLIHKIENILKK